MTKTTITTTQRWVLGLSALASFMVVLDLLVVATALPSIHRDLGASFEDLEWTVNAYTLSFAVLLMAGAALGDRLGRRRMFAAGLVLFAAASAACALAPSVGALVVARTVQGAGAAMIMPLALALLNTAFPPERRGWATGVYGSVTALGHPGPGLALDLLDQRADRSARGPAGALSGTGEPGRRRPPRLCRSVARRARGHRPGLGPGSREPYGLG
jgi:MFS family permease